MPSALKVANLDEMKRTILIVIVVSLSVFLLQEVTVAEDGFHTPDLFVPASLLAVALAVRLIPWEGSKQQKEDDESEAA